MLLECIRDCHLQLSFTSSSTVQSQLTRTLDQSRAARQLLGSAGMLKRGVGVFVSEKALLDHTACGGRCTGDAAIGSRRAAAALGGRIARRLLRRRSQFSLNAVIQVLPVRLVLTAITSMNVSFAFLCSSLTSLISYSDMGNQISFHA